MPKLDAPEIARLLNEFGRGAMRYGGNLIDQRPTSDARSFNAGR